MDSFKQQLLTASLAQVINDPGPDCLRLAAGSSDEENKLVMTESSGITKQLAAIQKDPNSKDEKMVENESLRHEEKRVVEVAQVWHLYPRKS